MDILAVTDAKFLYEVFIAIGLVFSSGSYAGMISTGMILGLLFTMMRALTTSKFETQYIFIGFLIYLGFIVPKVSVDIEDMHNPATVWTTPTNIPYGIAVIGNVMSTISLSIVDTIDTSFEASTTIPGMVGQNGFLGSLKKLEALSKAGGSAPEHLKSTIVSYYANCTHMGISDGSLNYKNIIDSDDPIGAILYNSDVFTTKLFGTGGTLSTVTCTEAYTQIEDWLDNTGSSSSSVVDKWSERLAKLTTERDVGEDVFASGSDMELAVQGVLGAGADALKLGIASLVNYAVVEGDREYAASSGSPLMYTMLSDATKQRNVDGYGAALGFQQVMRPFSAFIEAFFFAITPITVFLLMLGAYGVSMLGKYLQLYAWIQMWNPMMAIVNFFINYKLKDSVDSITCSLASCTVFPQLHSLTSIDAMTSNVGHWLHVGNTMAASVPILALILVTGSVYSINSVAQSMGGKDYMDEKKVAPDTFNTNAGKMSFGGNVVQTNQHGGASIGYGMVQDGAGRNLTLGSTFQNGITSGELATAAGSRVLSNEVTQAIGTKYGFNDDGTTTQGFDEKISAGGTKTHDAYKSLVQTLAKNGSITGDQKNLDSLTTALTANAGVSAPTYMGLNAGAAASYIQQQSEQLGLTTSSSLGSAVQDAFGDKTTLGSFIKSEGGYSESDIKKISAIMGYSKDSSNRVGDNYNETLTRARTASASAGTTQSMATAATLTYAEIASTAAPSWGAANGYDVSNGKDLNDVIKSYSTALEETSNAATRGGVAENLKLAELLSYSPMFSSFDAFIPTTKPYQVGDVQVPGSDRSTSDIKPKDLTQSSQTQKDIDSAHSIFSPGGAFETQRKEVDKNIPGSLATAQAKLEKRYENEGKPVDQFAAGNNSNYQEMIKQISDPATIQQIMDDVQTGGSDLTGATDKAAGNILTNQPEVAKAVQSSMPPKEINNSVAGIQNSIRELAAYALTQDGQISKDSTLVPTTRYGNPRHINEDFSSNVPGQSPASLIENLASSQDQGALGWVAQVTALGDIFEENGLTKPQATSLTPALLGDNSVWDSALEGKTTSSGEPITIKMVQDRVQSDWQRYPDTYSEMMFAPGGGQQANMSGRNENKWDTLNIPFVSYTPTDPSLLQDSKNQSFFSGFMNMQVALSIDDYEDQSQLGASLTDLKGGVQGAYSASVYNDVFSEQVNDVPWGVSVIGLDDLDELPQKSK